MVFSHEEKVIIKFFWTKYKYGATRNVNDHPGYEWNVNYVKKSLKRLTRLVTLLESKVLMV